MVTLKKVFWEIATYIVVVGIASTPGLIVCLFFDFMVDIDVNFFEKYSYSRMFFSLWFLIVNFAYFWGEKRDFIKKIF